MYDAGFLKEGDGSNWTARQDWEKSFGLVHNLFLTTVSPELKQLRERFVNEPTFHKVFDALQNTDHASSVQTRRCTCHHVISYMIKDEKLWCIDNRYSPRARPCVECIPRSEAIMCMANCILAVTMSNYSYSMSSAAHNLTSQS